MIQIGTGQAKRLLLFHPEQVSAEQFLAALRTHGVLNNGKNDEVIASAPDATVTDWAGLSEAGYIR